MNFQDQLNALAKEISDKETYFNISLIGSSISHATTDFDNITELLVKKRFVANEKEDWQLLNEEIAQAYFIKLFTKSLAYSTELFTWSEARYYWDVFGSILPDKPVFYANFSDPADVTNFIEGKSHGYSPITTATFDMALLFIGKIHVLGMVVTDED